MFSGTVELIKDIKATAIVVMHTEYSLYDLFPALTWRWPVGGISWNFGNATCTVSPGTVHQADVEGLRNHSKRRVCTGGFRCSAWIYWANYWGGSGVLSHSVLHDVVNRMRKSHSLRFGTSMECFIMFYFDSWLLLNSVTLTVSVPHPSYVLWGFLPCHMCVATSTSKHSEKLNVRRWGVGLCST